MSVPVFTSKDQGPHPLKDAKVSGQATAAVVASPVVVVTTGPAPKPASDSPLEGLMRSYRCRLTFYTPVLGSAPSNPDIYTEFIASKAPPEVDSSGEAAALPTDAEDRSTVFMTVRDERGEEHPVLRAYVIKGFFKEAGKQLRASGAKTATGALKAYRQNVDGLVRIVADPLPKGWSADIHDPILIQGIERMSYNQRPLRAETAQGARVTLASSQQLNEGIRIEFTIRTLGSVITEEILREWLSYGAFKGIGQWRSGGYGAFEFELTAL